MEKKQYHCGQCGGFRTFGSGCSKCRKHGRYGVTMDEVPHFSPVKKAYSTEPGTVNYIPPDVRQQKHYTQFKIQPVVFIAENRLGYLEGNVIKYVCRYKLKNGVEDLKKAKHYLDMLIGEVETGKVTP